ncbi:FAR1-related sequence 5-like protein, partial [Tanacetum coccineum]
MVVIDDHDIGEGSIPNDVFDVGEGSNTTAQEKIDESDRHDPDFRPSPKGTPYWVPYLPEDEKKPEIGDIFDTFDQGFDMYKAYAEKGRFNVRKSGQKTYKGKVTHKYVLCNKAGKVRDKFDKNTLKECDNENEKKDGKRKRKRKTKSWVTNCPAKVGLKAIRGTESWKIFYFVENHNHPLLNENNMDLSRARRQLHFGDYIFIHHASLSNIGPTIAHRLKVALIGGYDKVRGTPGDYRNFKRAVNLFIGDRDAQMIVDKMINRQLHIPKFSFEYHVFHDEYDFVFVPFTDPDSKHRLCMWHITQKLPGKVLGDPEADSGVRKEFHKLIWNVYISPEVFEKRWNALIN